ncbi:site-specific integrase [Flagellimonas profundi]|uniref:Site-specific integrase n=1 Tax=Flagellimonas profundi TaxID=2915620 RepID=A0ABS3FAK5_9FLAO|nr:site-specific integrase [Allomuricauda profundi]MBO0340183.1 site-specific integrase [Allomuricauda profundi]
MKNSHAFNIGFWLKKTARKPDGQVPIYARIRFEKQRSDLSVHRTVLEDHWCHSSGKVHRGFKGAASINMYLDDIQAKLLDCHRQLMAEGAPISARAIKDRFLGNDKPVQTLKDIFDFHRKHEIPKLAKGTIKNYSGTETYLLRFVKQRYRTSDAPLSLVDYAFLIEFETYLRNCETIVKNIPLSNNGIMKHMERFKKMVTLAHKFGCISRNPFTLYKMKFESYDSDFLEEEEIQRLRNLVLKNSSLDMVRDIFIFSCYTGLSYIEVKLLKTGDIVKGLDGDQWINVRRKKTNTPVKVPLLYDAKCILEKYEYFPDYKKDGSLLPVFSNQKVNKYLKEVVKRAKINKKVTFHVARHTFATTITLMNDVPIETVSKLLGHTKLSTTQKYARVVEKKISKDMSKLKEALKGPKDGGQTLESESAVATNHKRKGHLRVVK